MIEIVERATGSEPAAFTLALPFDDRQRSRLRVQFTTGEVAALALTRGTVLRGGDRLRSACGRIVQVVAAPEHVSVAESADTLVLARAAYHLGNRHIPVEVRATALVYLHDHVLDDMVRGLGLRVRSAQEAFEPEGGAYASRGHSHGAHAHGEHAHGEHAHAHGEHAHAHGESHGHVAIRVGGVADE